MRLELLLLGSLLCCAACKREPAVELTADGRQLIKVTVDATGYHPAESHANAGKPVRLELTRTTDAGCGQELVIPSAKIKRDLPLNQAVSIDLTMPADGALAFACGMDMYRGKIIAD